MPKHYFAGLAVLAIGAGVGLFFGGAIGLVLATICLVLGLVLLMESQARRTRLVAAQATRPAHQKTEVVFLIKEVHVRPQIGGKFRELVGQGDVAFDFEVFLLCWMVNETELPLRIQEGPKLTLKRTAAPFVIAERVTADLDRWRLGKLNQQLDTNSDLLVLRAAQESISEFDVGDPLVCGVPRKGWLHFRVTMTASEFEASSLELSLTDSQGNLHLSTLSGPRFLPGRIWPFLDEVVPDIPNLDVRNNDPYPGTSLATGT